MTIDWSVFDWGEIGEATLDTFLMIGFSLPLTVLLGLPLGILLFLTARGQMLQQPLLNMITGQITNIVRSIPFIILIVWMIPVTEWLVGTSLGVRGTVVPLVLGATPFFARLAETALREVDRGVIEAMQSLGATRRQIIYKGLLPEALPGLVASITVTAITLLSYTAMAGMIGGGGLGALGINYGYYRYVDEIMNLTVFILVIIVFAMQSFGDWLVHRVSHR